MLLTCLLGFSILETVLGEDITVPSPLLSMAAVTRVLQTRESLLYSKTDANTVLIGQYVHVAKPSYRLKNFFRSRQG